MGNGNTEMTIQAKAINLFKYLQAMQEKQDSGAILSKIYQTIRKI